MHTPSESLTHDDSQPLKTSTPSHEIDTTKRIETLESIENQELKDKSLKPGESIDAELSALSEATAFAEKHDYWGQAQDHEDVLNALIRKSKEYKDLGLSLDDIFSNPQELKKFGIEVRKRISDEKNKEAVETDETLQSRFQELQKSNDSVASILQTLKIEFAKTIDEETSAVLDKYSSLLSPDIFSDKDEREAVETLFYTQSGTFTNESFSNFVQAVYEQPDDLISEGSKVKIEKAFKISRTPIKTGKELSKFTQLTKEDGSFVHDSAKNALEFRPGVKTHMNAQGKAVLTLEGKSHPHPLTLPQEALKNGESIAEYANYALIRQTVYDELGQLTNLFGGGEEEETALPDEHTREKANRFAQLLIGRKSPETILSQENLSDLRSALKALHDPSFIGETASLNTMGSLGMLQNGDFQWERVDHIGQILRENQFYKTFEMEKEGASHDLLSAEIERLYPYGHIQKEKMSATKGSGHFFFYRWNWWLSRVLIKSLY